MGKRFQKQAALVFAVVLLVCLLWIGRHVILLGFTGLLLALALSALVNQLRRWLPLSHKWALGLVLLLLLSLALLGGALLVPALSEQFASLAETLPKQIERLRADVEKSPIYKNVIAQSERYMLIFSKSQKHHQHKRKLPTSHNPNSQMMR